MPAVMEGHRLRIDMGFKRGGGIRERRQREGTRGSLEWHRAESRVSGGGKRCASGQCEEFPSCEHGPL
jgi:hypothetical protein